MANESRVELVITVDASGAVTGIRKVTDEKKKLGTEADNLAKGPMKTLSDTFDDLSRRGTGLLGTLSPLITGVGAFGAAIGVAALMAKTSIDNFTRFADEVRNLSYLSGGSARDVSVLVSGLSDLGVESTTVEMGLSQMSAAIERGSPALNKLGVSVRDANGNLKSGLTLFYDTIDALGKMKNEVERNAIARELFSRQWIQMIDVIKMGSAAVKQFGEENAAAGQIVTEQGLQAARDYQLAVKNLGNAWEGFTVQVGSRIVPGLTAILNAITPVTKSLEDQRRLVGEVTASFDAYAAGLQKVEAARAMHLPTILPDVAEQLTRPAPAATAERDAETAAEMKRRLTLASQMGQLIASAHAAAARTEDEQLLAQIGTVRAQRVAAQNAINIAVREGAYQNEKEVAGLRLAIDADANAKILAARQRLAELQRTRDIANHVAVAQAQIDADFDAANAIAEADERQADERKRLRDLTNEEAIKSLVALAEYEVQLAFETADAKWKADQARLQWEADARREIIELQQVQYDLQMQQYEAALAQLFEQANAVGGEAGKGLGLFAAGLKGITDVQAGQDPYSQEFQRAVEHFDRMNELYAQHKISEAQINAHYNQLMLANSRMVEQQSLEGFAAAARMGSGLFLALYNLTGQKQKELFIAHQAFAVAEALINTYAAVTMALRSAPPPWNFALAAAVSAFGMAQVASIAAQKPSGMASASATSGGGGYAYSQPTTSQWEQPQTETPRSVSITVNVLGNVVDHDAFARELISALKKAEEDGQR